MPADIKNEERVVITAKISQQSANGFRHFCDSNGISLTALLEVAGLDLMKESAPPVDDTRFRAVEAAREVDRLRRIRRR